MTFNVRHRWLRQEGDCEIYKAGRNYVLAVWGWATGGDIGPHNEFDTQVAVYIWEGEEPNSAEDLPQLHMSAHWAPYKGFNFAEDSDGSPDWGDYEEKLNDILDEIAVP